MNQEHRTLRRKQALAITPQMGGVTDASGLNPIGLGREYMQRRRSQANVDPVETNIEARDGAALTVDRRAEVFSDFSN